MTLVRRYFICAVLCAVLRNSSRTRRVRSRCMRDARPSLFIFAVLSAVLRSGFRDTAEMTYNVSSGTLTLLYHTIPYRPQIFSGAQSLRVFNYIFFHFLHQFHTLFTFYFIHPFSYLIASVGLINSCALL